MSSPTNARQRKAQRELEKKRRQQLIILVGIVIATVVILVVVVLMSQSMTTPTPVVNASGESSYTALTPSVSPENMPQLGSADAPLTIYEYGSFGCSHCMDFHNDQFQQLKTNIEAGQVRFVFVPVDLNQFTQQATRAAFCAADQDRFWEMGDILFNYLAQYGSAAFPESRLLEAARSLGLNENDFRTCLASSRSQARADASNQLFRNLADQYPDKGITGTPTFTFNGVPEYGAGNLPMSSFEDQIRRATGG
jgi:protein-disulfide isomerase